MKSRFIIIFIVFSISIVGCAKAPEKTSLNTSNSLKISNSDPLEPINRVIFSFNNIFDRAVLRPIAVVYRGIVPEFVRNRVTYSLNNLSMPVTAVNNVLQGEFAKAGVSTSRFLINSTIGFLGFFDPAASLGLESEKEDFGQTLTVWGVPSGPYLVLPFIGPSNPRDFTGFLSTSLLDPMYQVGGGSSPTSLRSFRIATGAVDFRQQNIETFDDLQNNSLDFYTAVRSFYTQNRDGSAINNQDSDEELFDMLEEIDDDDTYIGPDITIEGVN